MLIIQNIILIMCLFYSLIKSVNMFSRTSSVKGFLTYLLLPGINLFLLIHVLFNIVLSYNFFIKIVSIYNILIIIDIIFCILFAFIVISFILDLIIKNITKIQMVVYLGAWGIIWCLLVLFYIQANTFELDLLHSITYVSKFLQYTLFFLTFIFLNMYLIFGEDRGLLIYLNGLIIIVLYELLTLYPINIDKYHFGFLVDITLIVGVFIYTYGIRLFSKNMFKDAILWLNCGNKIKSILVLWCYMIILITFFVIGLITHYISIVQIKVIPLYLNIIITMSLLSINLLRILGGYIELSFVKLKHNILQTFQNDKSEWSQINIDEFIFLEQFIKKIFIEQAAQEKLNLAYQIENQKISAISTEQEKFRKSIGKLVHDMNSPLETINGVLRLLSSAIPEDSKHVINNSVRRLSGLAHGVLNKYKNLDVEDKKIIPLLLALSIEGLFNEKLVEYNDLNISFSLDISKESYSNTIMIDHDEFRRMLSNLINNAVDACKNSINPTVKLKLKTMNEWVILFIEDNGYGMPKHIIDKFMKGDSVTEKKPSGHGIGLTQIFETIKSGNGEVNVSAQDCVGTEIMIRFPLCEKPWWLTKEIKLLPDSIIVIVDDEQGVHDMWDKKLEEILTNNPAMQVKHFMDGVMAINYINSLSKAEQLKVHLLTDYNLENQRITGLDIIDQVSVRDVVIISNYNNLEYEINNYINKLHLIPKKFLYLDQVKIKLDISRDFEHVDMIWLDDQVDFVDIIIKENYSHLKIEKYNNPEELLKEIEQYKNKDVKVILDNYYELENGVLYPETGVEIGKRLYKMGYSNIVLLTGSGLDEDKIVPDYIKVIIKTDSVMLGRLYHL